ncbi:hypothetical protein [Pseudobythopirellula maris]|uniref:hypothetical protein n=1 Tax=Pseudobythopirellula maris TaxID=2527991 RepID=UPI0011B4435D|nr:hypothetical protein [Pseudobythopirellula maris]
MAACGANESQADDAIGPLLGGGGVQVDRILSRADIRDLRLEAPAPRVALRPGATRSPVSSYPETLDELHAPLALREPVGGPSAKGAGKLSEAFNVPRLAAPPITPIGEDDLDTSFESAEPITEPSPSAGPVLSDASEPAPLSPPKNLKPLGDAVAIDDKAIATDTDTKAKTPADESSADTATDSPVLAKRPTSKGPRALKPKAESQESEPVTARPEATPSEKAEPKAAEPAAKPQAEPQAEPDTEIDEQEPVAAAPVEPPKPLSRNLMRLKPRLRTVLSYYYRQPLNSIEHDPWEVMHGMLAYELHSRVLDNGPNGDPITAIGYLCYNKPCKRLQMMRVSPEGELDVRVGVGMQGHKGQLLAMLAQCNVSPDYPIRVDGQEFTIHDLIRAEQKTCYTKTELTFKLIGLMHYLDSDARWVNDQGEAWDMPRLVREEREQPIRGAACGGTHRLGGLSLAIQHRLGRGEPIDGEYAAADKFIKEYQNYAYRLQNQDGSMSTEWFRGPGAEEDIDRRIRTTGHTLEWLIYSHSDEELRDYRIYRTVSYLTNLMATNADHDWHKGSIAHALHALVMYDKRVFQPFDVAPDGLAESLPPQPGASLYRNYSMYRGVMRNSPSKPSGFFGLFGTSQKPSSSSRR